MNSINNHSPFAHAISDSILYLITIPGFFLIAAKALFIKSNIKSALRAAPLPPRTPLLHQLVFPNTELILAAVGAAAKSTTMWQKSRVNILPLSGKTCAIPFKQILTGKKLAIYLKPNPLVISCKYGLRNERTWQRRRRSGIRIKTSIKPSPLLLPWPLSFLY